MPMMEIVLFRSILFFIYKVPCNHAIIMPQEEILFTASVTNINNRTNISVEDIKNLNTIHTRVHMT